MESEYKEGLRENNEKYKKGLVPDSNNIIIHNENHPEIYNLASFQSNVIILQKTKLLKNNFICQICGSQMKMATQNNSIDKVIWRCHKRAPPHDVKTNIREGSIFEGFQIEIYILYF